MSSRVLNGLAIALAIAAACVVIIFLHDFRLRSLGLLMAAGAALLAKAARGKR